MSTQNSNMDALSIEGELKKCNFANLAELGRRAIGNRKIVDFCEQTGLSSSFVSRLINEKLVSVPSKRTIYRFAGPATNPQNNVTVTDMLEAAGYETEISELDTIITAPQKKFYTNNIKVPMQNSISYYYSQNPTLGLDMMIRHLLNKGYCIPFSVEFQIGIFKIFSKEEKIKFVGLPAFCSCEKNIEPMKISITQRFISSLSEHSMDSIYVIITDNVILYDSLSKDFKVMPKIKVVLLYTEDYNEFLTQNYLGTKKEDIPDDISSNILKFTD